MRRSQVTSLPFILHLALCALCSAIVCAQPSPVIEVRPVPWQQVSDKPVFVAFPEREEYSTLDRVGRIVFAVETGGGPKLADLSLQWRLQQGDRVVAGQTSPIDQGLVDVTLDLRPLNPGRYDLTAKVLNGAQTFAEKSAFFNLTEHQPPPQQGRVPVILPNGIPPSGWPVQFGVPFPKGALWSEKNVRLVRSDGTTVPCGVTVRSRWGHRPESSIRWLGVDFQPDAAAPWWPARKEAKYFIEFGPQVVPQPAAASLKIGDTPEGVDVDTGPLRFLVRKQGFNLIDNVRLNGTQVLASTPGHGLYLVDHEGAVYRAANDRAVSVSIEERTDLRVVIRAEGWYVKDGVTAPKLSYSLPTDKLCKFVTRIEAYAGKPWVRVLSTWIITYDSFTVRLRDVGFSLPLAGATRTIFGVEDGAPVAQPVPKDGVRLVQHLHDAFAVESGAGKELARGARSAGWMTVAGGNALVTLGHRETWQRFPKELEALPGELRFHLWPAHGRAHPEINETARDQIHRLWYAHQGRELSLVCPWKYYFATAEYYNDPSAGAYKAGGHAMTAVHGVAMGLGITSDCLIQFAAPGAEMSEASVAAAFQARPHALADPKWTCDSLAIGWQHPYDPERFPGAEEIISDGMRAYWKTQDAGRIYGMWLYRPWHHSGYFGKGTWDLYRLYNGSHHYEAIMPWLFYARSGDPFYWAQGMANVRELTDVQIKHYADPEYMQKDYMTHQRRLVGAMQHDDSIAPWTGDFAILGHVTCYNGPILAHYLTGDLRVREVLVDEWQRTLVSDRANREYLIADLSPTIYPQNPRNNSSSIGELIDLYQLTYDPRLLALLSTRLDIYFTPGCMGVDWGYPLHNLLLFHGSNTARRELLEGVPAYIASGEKSYPPKSAWRPLHVLSESYALAGILKPDAPYALDSFYGVDLNYWRHWVWRVGALEPRIPLCPYPDTAIYLPRCMYALAHSVHKDTTLAFGDFQEMPRISGKPLRCIVREDNDRDFTVYLIGRVKQPFAVQVFGPDNQLIAERQVQAGHQSPFALTVPKDGKTGQYVIFIGAGQPDVLFVPVTTLPEVYVTSYWTGNNNGQQFFTRATGDKPEKVEIQPHKGPGKVLSADKSRVLAGTETGEVMKAEIGPEGAWIYNQSCYIGSGAPLILARSPARWFAPDKDKLELQMKK